MVNHALFSFSSISLSQFTAVSKKRAFASHSNEGHTQTLDKSSQNVR